MRCFAAMSPRSIFFASSTSCAAVRSWWRPASRRKSCSASVVVSSGAGPAAAPSRLRLGLGLVLGLDEQLDAASVELLVDRLDLERIELERLEHLDELGLLELAARLGGFEQRRQLLSHENRLDLDGRQIRSPSIGAPGRRSRLANLPKHAGRRGSSPVHEKQCYVK